MLQACLYLVENLDPCSLFVSAYDALKFLVKFSGTLDTLIKVICPSLWQVFFLYESEHAKI